MSCPEMGGRPLEIGSGSKRWHLFLKAVCMHALAHIHICVLLGRWRTMQCLQEIQILKKKVKPNLLWPKLPWRDMHINTLFFRRGTLCAFCYAPEQHPASGHHQLEVQNFSIIQHIPPWIARFESTSPKLHLEIQVTQDTKQWPSGF